MTRDTDPEVLAARLRAVERALTDCDCDHDADLREHRPPGGRDAASPADGDPAVTVTGERIAALERGVAALADYVLARERADERLDDRAAAVRAAVDALDGPGPGDGPGEPSARTAGRSGGTEEHDPDEGSRNLLERAVDGVG